MDDPDKIILSKRVAGLNALKIIYNNGTCAYININPPYSVMVPRYTPPLKEFIGVLKLIKEINKRK